jgi:hypothetical protein
LPEGKEEEKKGSGQSWWVGIGCPSRRIIKLGGKVWGTLFRATLLFARRLDIHSACLITICFSSLVSTVKSISRRSKPLGAAKHRE